MHRASHLLILVAALGLAGELPASPRWPSGACSIAEAVTLKQAHALNAQHELPSAPNLLRTYLAGDAGATYASVLLAEVGQNANKPANATRLLGEAPSDDPQVLAEILAAGKVLLSEQRYPEAMDRFEAVLQLSPHDQEARNLELEAVTKLAVSAAQAGNPEAALKAFEHARTKMPDNSRLLMELALQAIELRLFSEADEALQTARRLDPHDPDLLYASARLALEEQHMPAAEAHLRAYLAARPNDASAHYGLGHILAMEQRDDEARKEFVRSTELQPLQAESYYQIGQLDLNAGQSDEAAKLFQRVILRDPNHGGALVGLGQIAFQARNYPQAATFLERAVKAAPEYGPAHYYYGLTLARLGRKTEADEELKKATELGQAAAKPVQAAPTGP